MCIRGLFLVGALIALLACPAGAAAEDKVSLNLQLDSPEALRGGVTGLDVLAEIQRGWHINGHKPTDPYLIPTAVTFSLPPGVSTGEIIYPPADRKTFAFAQGKELLVYEGQIGIATSLNVPANFSGSRLPIKATLRYQACNDSTCSPPASVDTELAVQVSATVAAAPTAAAARPDTHHGAFDVGNWIARRGLPFTLVAVALLGLSLNLTPCVYPLISATVAYFGAQARARDLPAAVLAGIYVLGITSSFSAVGVAAALSGGMFGAALQKPLVLLFIAAVLVALALSSFGIYQLRPPQWLMQRASRSGRGVAGAFFMGLTMGVVAAPCVGPVVLGLLVFVGSQQNVLLGFELFFALGLGMGLPYFLLATAAGSIKALPRSGEWLTWVERVFGVMLLGLAAYFVSPLLPGTLSRLLLPALIAIGGVYLGFIDRSGQHWRLFRSVQRIVGVLALASAVWLGLPQRAESGIAWQPFQEAGIDAARHAGRPVIIDFMAQWCIPCHEMEGNTYTDPKVRQAAERFEMFKADITHDTDETMELTERYHVQGVPTVILLDSNGTEVQRLVGYVGPEEMLGAMNRVRG